MTRHLGRNAETDKQAVVVFMLIPEQQTHALVAYPDLLSETLRRELMNTVSSLDAQRTETLADVIGRRQYADTQKSVLQVLHEAQQLHRVEIDNLVMTPDGNHRLPLRTVLEAMGRIEQPAGEEKFNPHNYNTVVEGQEEQVGIARNLLVEAEMLEADARAKRAKAYQLAPSMNPTKSPPSVLTETGSTGATPSESQSLPNG